MELRHLRVFLTLSEELHFGRTAARHHVAQSAISQTLRDLEAELDARLLERTSRQVKLTEAGLAFLSYAREATQVVDRGMKAARAAHSRGGRLRIRLLATGATKNLPALLKKFQHECPLTVLDVRDGSSARNLEALEAAYCDLAFLSLASAKRLGSAYAQTTFESGPLGIVVPASHRLAKREAVHMEDLRGEKVLCLQRDEEPDVRMRLDARLASVGAILTGIELSYPQALLPLVAAGLGVAILPCFVARDALPGLRAVPIAGMGDGGVIAAWNKQQRSEALERFVALMALVA